MTEIRVMLLSFVEEQRKKVMTRQAGKNKGKRMNQRRDDKKVEKEPSREVMEGKVRVGVALYEAGLGSDAPHNCNCQLSGGATFLLIGMPELLTSDDDYWLRNGAVCLPKLGR